MRGFVPTEYGTQKSLEEKTIPAHLSQQTREFFESVARINEVDGGRNPADLITRFAEKDIAIRGEMLYTQDPKTGVVTEVGSEKPS